MIRHWDSYSTPDDDTAAEYALDAARERQSQYTKSVVDAAGGDQRHFLEWLDEQDGHCLDRDTLLHFIEKPWKWQTEWQRFTKEMESQ